MAQKRFWTPPTLGSGPPLLDTTDRVPFWVTDYDGEVPLIDTPVTLTATQQSAAQAALLDTVDSVHDLPQNTRLGQLQLETDYDVTLTLKSKFRS